MKKKDAVQSVIQQAIHDLENIQQEQRKRYRNPSSPELEFRLRELKIALDSHLVGDTGLRDKHLRRAFCGSDDEEVS